MRIYPLRGANKMTSERRQENLSIEIDHSTQEKMLCRSSPKDHRRISKAEPKQQMNIMEFQPLYHRQDL
jgi:hypothetical protein